MLDKYIFWTKIIDGKINPTKGPYTESKFEHNFWYNIALLLVKITELQWGSERSVMADSGFGYVPSVVQIKNRRLVAMTAIKNKAHSPNHMEAQ